MGKPDRENFPWNLVISSCLLDSGSTSVRCLIFERDLVLAEGLGEWSVFPPGDWGSLCPWPSAWAYMLFPSSWWECPRPLPGLLDFTITRTPGARKHLGTQCCEFPPLLPRGLGLYGDASGDTAGEASRRLSADGSNKAAFLVTLVNRQVLFHLVWRGHSDVKER